MLKHWQDQVYFVSRLMDLAVGVFAFFLAYHARFDLGLSEGILSFQSYGWLLAATLVLHAVLYPYFGFYGSLRLKSPFDIVLMILRAGVVEFFLLGSIVFLLQAKETSRYFFFLYVSLNYLMILTLRISARTFLGAIRTRGYNYRQILVLGDGIAARQILGAIQRNRHWGYYLFGVLSEQPASNQKEVLGVPVVGSIADFERILATHTVDEVIVAMERYDSSRLQQKVLLCETMGIPVRLTWGRFGMEHSRRAYSEFDGVPLITFYNTAFLTPSQAFAKRLMDVLGSMVGIAITAVLYPYIAYRIRKESPGPVIFKQIRVGQNGRRFKCYKFRTMGVDAESRKKELLADNEMQGPMFKVAHDPRIFPFGAFLRRTSLDELPQFINVFRGDMSLVGTRPPTPDEVETYEPHYRRRLSIRPGLTGLWQVSGRSRVNDFDKVLRFDLDYIDNWSLGLDVRILVRTLVAVFQRQGAH